MNGSALEQPIQRHLDLIEVSFPRSSLTWTAPKQEWRHFSQCVLLLSGHARVRFKGAHLDLSRQMLLWSPPGMMQSCEFAAGSQGRLLTVSEDWLIPAVNRQLDPEVPFRTLADTLHELSLNDDLSLTRFQPCFQAIRAELHDNDSGSRSVVAAQLTTLLALIHRQDTERPPEPGDGRIHSSLFQRFLQLVELHFREHWKVSDYAIAMGVTERRLEFATQRDSGQSPVRLIQRKLVAEACQRLAHSPLSIGEVAYGLGFRDPAYFNRFFKRHMGHAPGIWRRRVRAQAPHPDTTFAAWP